MKYSAPEPALPGDGPAILAVLEHYNMHHVPSAEMEELNLGCFFVVRREGEVIGAAGYRLLGDGHGKTTLLGVSPEHARGGIGGALQDARLEAMRDHGVHTVTTNADRPETIAWYKRRYGYREVGTLEKVCEFGLPDVSYWTTLELDLTAWARTGPRGSAATPPFARP